MKNVIILTMVVMLLLGASFSLASEEKNHVCFHMVDTNGDGQITPQEFQAVYDKNPELFKVVDVDGNGRLIHDEYHDALGDGVL